MIDRNHYQVIVEFANGDGSLRNEAIAAFHKELRRIALLNSDLQRKEFDIHAIKFMSEIDNKCPDYALRARVRADLLEEAKGQGVLSDAPTGQPRRRPERLKLHRKPPDMKVAHVRGRRR